MPQRRKFSIVLVVTALVMLTTTLAVSRRWPNSRRVEYARAVGRYHAYKQTDKFYQRATPGGVSRKAK